MESSITEEGELVRSLKKQLKDLQEEKEEVRAHGNEV